MEFKQKANNLKSSRMNNFDAKLVRMLTKFDNIFEIVAINRWLGVIFVFHNPTYVHGKKDSN